MIKQESTPSYELYRGKTASDIEYEELVRQLGVEDIDLYSVSARKLMTDSSAPYTYEVFSSAWYEDDPDRTTRNPDPEFYVNVNTSVVVRDNGGQRVARIEAKFHITYYSFIVMDDDAFVTFSERRVMDDVWPELSPVVEDMLHKMRIYVDPVPRRISVGPNVTSI